MVHISFSVYAIQILQALLTSLGFCTYMMKCVLKCYIAMMRYCILKTKI